LTNARIYDIMKIRSIKNFISDAFLNWLTKLKEIAMKGRKNAIKFADAVLCYVEGWAYFTTQELTKQRGDAWSRAPYEHNAGGPYKPCWHNESEHLKKRGGKMCQERCCKEDWNSDGTPKWQIVEVTYDGPFQTPEDLFPPNSHFSVESINAGRAPWLTHTKTESILINAGTTLKDFVKLIGESGGEIHQVRVV